MGEGICKPRIHQKRSTYHTAHSQTIQLERAKAMNRYFTEEEIHTEMRTRKDAQHDWPIKPQCDIATQLSDGLKKGDQCWGVAEKLDAHSGCGNEGAGHPGQCGGFAHRRPRWPQPRRVPGTYLRGTNLCPHRPLHRFSEHLYNEQPQTGPTGGLVKRADPLKNQKGTKR